MKFLTLNDLKDQLRIERNDTSQDTELTRSALAAERKIFSDTGYTYEELLARGDDGANNTKVFPEDLVQAGLMLAATWYKYRENLENVSMYHVDYSYEYLISDYVKHTF
jgi:hypothetical protein